MGKQLDLFHENNKTTNLQVISFDLKCRTTISVVTVAFMAAVTSQ